MAIVDLEATLAGSSTVAAQATAGYAVASTLGGTSQVGATAAADYAAAAALGGASTFSSALTVVTGFAAPVRYVPSARTVQSGRMVLEQVDFFLGDGITRAQGITTANLQLRVYLNGSQLSWALVTGVGIPDVRVSAGRIYWTEFSAGFYNVRFFPNVLGLWRLILTYPTHNQAVSLTYDVVPQTPLNSSVGLRTSFFRG